MITLKDEWYVVIMAYTFILLEIFCITICCVSTPSQHIESTDDIFIIQSDSYTSLLRAMVAEKATLQVLIARSLFTYRISYSRSPAPTAYSHIAYRIRAAQNVLAYRLQYSRGA